MYSKLKWWSFTCTLLWECKRCLGTIFCVKRTVTWSWARLLAVLLVGVRDAALHRTVCGNQGRALLGSAHLVEKVLAMGKSVWSAVWLLKSSGPAEPHRNPLFYNNSTGEQRKVAPVTISFELCHQNFENVIFFLYFLCFCFFSLQLFYCFDPKWFVWPSAVWN